MRLHIPGAPGWQRVRTAAAVRAVQSRRRWVTVAAAALLPAMAAAWPTRAAAQVTDISDRPTQENDNAIFDYTRLELDAARRGGSGEQSWTGEGWIGTDFNRVWWKTQGDREGNTLSGAEAQLLYGRYVRPFWDMQIGYRRVIRPAGENFLVLAMQGVAPYRFEVDGSAFVSEHGRLSGRGEVDYELLWTNRLISRPGVTADVFATRDPILGQAAGIGDVEVRLPTRYEFSRQFAPYVELRHDRRSGGAAALARGAGAPSGWSLRGGVWLIF